MFFCKHFGYSGANGDTISLAVRSTIRRRPEDLAAGSPDGVFTAEHGARVTIPCDISRPQDGTTVVYQWYRDGQPVVTLTGTGTLVLEGVDEEDRGRYQCVVEIRASGVEGQPLEELIGDVTVGVGGVCRLRSIPVGMELNFCIINFH